MKKITRRLSKLVILKLVILLQPLVKIGDIKIGDIAATPSENW